MNTYSSMLNSIVANSVDKQEVIDQFDAFKNNGIGLTIGFIEERLDYDFAYKSKEYNMYWKIILKSYEFHKLTDDFEYVTHENENI